MSILQRFTNATTIRHSNGLCKKIELSFRSNFHPRINASTSSKNSQQELARNPSKKQDWITVYQLPMIRWASSFNRLKLYQAAFTTAGIPTSFILENAELLSAGTCSIFGAIGITGIITLGLSSLIVKNLIGLIYINKDNNQLKFAYVDYWGRRQDIVLNIYDLVPNGAQQNPAGVNFYQKIGLKSNEKLQFKLLQRYGIVSQPRVFDSLFY